MRLSCTLCLAKISMIKIRTLIMILIYMNYITEELAIEVGLLEHIRESKKSVINISRCNAFDRID